MVKVGMAMGSQKRHLLGLIKIVLSLVTILYSETIVAIINSSNRSDRGRRLADTPNSHRIQKQAYQSSLSESYPNSTNFHLKFYT